MSVVLRVKKSNTIDLEQRLGYQFTNAALLKTALTHRSFSADHNERLEFLGDSILNFTIAEALYTQFPEAREGQLSRLRAEMVKGETLAEIAREFALGNHLYLGEGELRSGGRERASILADAVEAIIGGIYFDAGMEAVKPLILTWFATRLKALNLAKHQNKDAKSILQEWLQGRKKALPEYEVIKVEGELHEQLYTVSCTVKSLKVQTQGVASNRKTAEKLAAADMIKLLEIA